MNPWKSPNASLAQTYKPPSFGNREDSSLMTSALGTKNKTAARTHKLIDEVPLCAAAAIHRGPSTVAILNSNTSQKPIVLGNAWMGLEELAAGSGLLKRSRSLNILLRTRIYACRSR